MFTTAAHVREAARNDTSCVVENVEFTRGIDTLRTPAGSSLSVRGVGQVQGLVGVIIMTTRR